MTKPKRTKKVKAVKAWAIMDGDVVVDLYACDSMFYAMRKYMGLTFNTSRDQIQKLWDVNFGSHRHVVEFECSPVTPKPRKRK
jgi:hypothetical protein